MYRGLVTLVICCACVAGAPNARLEGQEINLDTVKLHFGRVSRSTPVAILHDGKRAIAAHERSLRIWDLATGNDIRGFHVFKRNILSLAVSPDAKSVAVADGDRLIRLWDLETGRETGKLSGHRGLVGSVAFSPNGKILASAALIDGVRSIRLWDSTTGLEFPRIDSRGGFFCLRFSSCGKWLGAREINRGVSIWDVATGKKQHTFDDLMEFAFVSDGITVGGWSSAGAIVVRSLADGQVTCSFTGPMRPGVTLNPFVPLNPFELSPDGRLLALKSEKIQLWEVATGKVRRTLPLDTSILTDFAFSPDGRTLVSASNTKNHVWRISRKAEERPAVLTQEELETLWRDLASGDGERADRAIWLLADSAKQALPLLQGRLKPVQAADPARVLRLLADLDSERFSTRDKSARELESLGELAGPALQKMSASKTSVEVRRRVDELLKRIQGPVVASEFVRYVRSAEVLERIATAEAKQLLERLAQGTPEARVTQHARAALGRMARQVND